MRGTAEAAARQQATAEVVTATAAAATATRQAINADLEVRATQLALEAIAGQQTREHQATAVALEQLAQAEALLLRDHEAELANRRRQETIALQRQQVMVYVAPRALVPGAGRAGLPGLAAHPLAAAAQPGGGGTGQRP
ncbi:MAG: hypothetical protein IPM76_24005 [Chloroflexi bacterium]|nr:hypothetical protein [Chloroflexota bacterium]